MCVVEVDSRQLTLRSSPQVTSVPGYDLPGWPMEASGEEPIRVKFYVDGSYTEESGDAAAAALIWSDERKQAHARDPNNLPKIQGNNAMFPPNTSGARLASTFAKDNNNAEAVAVLTALASIPPEALVVAHVMSDSTCVEKSIKEFRTLRNLRKQQSMHLRAYMGALHSILARGTCTMVLEHVEAHRDSREDETAWGNNAADLAAKRLAARPPGPGESMLLQHCDSIVYVPHLWDLNRAEHVTGGWKEAVKVMLGEKAKAHVLRPDSSQSYVARGYTDGAAAVAARGGAANVAQAKEAQANALYSLVQSIGRRIRGADVGSCPMSGNTQRFFTRLAAGTLKTLLLATETVKRGPTPAAREAMLERMALKTPGMRFVLAGWTKEWGGAAPAGGAAVAWSPICPLCRKDGRSQAPPDSQDHFASCPLLRDEWKAAIKGAIESAIAQAPRDMWTSPDRGHADLRQMVSESLANYLLSDGGHYTRRCGLFSAADAHGAIKRAHKTANVRESVPSSDTFFKTLRLELVRSASSLYHSRLARLESIGSEVLSVRQPRHQLADHV